MINIILNSLHHLTTYTTKIARLKTKRRNKMDNESYNDTNDINNNNENQFDLSLPKIWWLEWLPKVMVNMRKT